MFATLLVLLLPVAGGLIARFCAVLAAREWRRTTPNGVVIGACALFGINAVLWSIVLALIAVWWLLGDPMAALALVAVALIVGALAPDLWAALTGWIRDPRHLPAALLVLVGGALVLTGMVGTVLGWAWFFGWTLLPLGVLLLVLGWMVRGVTRAIRPKKDKK